MKLYIDGEPVEIVSVDPVDGFRSFQSLLVSSSDGSQSRHDIPRDSRPCRLRTNGHTYEWKDE